jgi:hypothetical protein
VPIDIIDIHQAVLAVICLGLFVCGHLTLGTHISMVACVPPDLKRRYIEHGNIFGLRICDTHGSWRRIH